MTLTDWAAKQTGWIFKIPKGTRTGRVIHEYQLSTGAWVQDPKVHGEKWDELPKRMRYEETDQDHYVELQLDGHELELMALKATKNRSGRTVDGPITLRRRR